MLQTLREFSRRGERQTGENRDGGVESKEEGGERGRIATRKEDGCGIKGPETDRGMIAAPGLIIPALLAGNLNFARKPEAGMYTGSVICCN